MTIPAPTHLIDENGHPVIGHFDGIPKTINIAQFDYRNSMDTKVLPWQKHFHYKQFQFVSIVTEAFIIGVAIADIRYLGSAFCYLYDRNSNVVEENSWLRPFNLDLTTTNSPYNGATEIACRQVMFSIANGQWKLHLNTKHVKANIKLTPKPTSQPMAMCSPTGYSGWTYTQKHNALALSGHLIVDGNDVDLASATGGYDFSCGYMRRETSWRWASINTYINGVSFGLNLAAGVNETGGCENALWVDGVRFLLGPVHFNFSRTDTEQAWQIHSTDGRVRLTFSLLNKRSEKLNLWLLKSNFRQFIGYFNGSIEDHQGTIHQLENVIGLTEDHFARW